MFTFALVMVLILALDILHLFSYWSPCWLQVSTTVTVDEALTGLKTSFAFKVPDHKSGKVSVFGSKGGNISLLEYIK
jgi:hypothetical protein